MTRRSFLIILRVSSQPPVASIFILIVTLLSVTHLSINAGDALQSPGADPVYKEVSVLVAPQLGIALSYLSFRNHALHAEWQKIDRASVQSVLGFVEQLLLKHFA